tara:strand:+ start:191 stop:631 length:441 start_codon:yes stop_codon:yes gene_type:complete
MKLIMMNLLINFLVSCTIIFGEIELGFSNEIFSKQILRCNEDCELTQLTWEQNYGKTNVKKGLFQDSTMHYCSSKDSWDPIIRWWNIGGQYHMFAQQLLKGQCFQISEMQDYIAVELVKDKGKLKVYRAEWIYNQPQEIYVLQIIE